MHFGDRLKFKNKPVILVFFLAILIIGLLVYKDYGVSTDEPQQREIGLTSLSYIANLFNIPFLLGTTQPLTDPASVFLTQRDRDYGVAFELPAELLIKIFGLNDTNAYFFRHLLTFLIFYAALFFFYKLVKLRYQDWRIGLLGAVFLVLSPRFFGDSFFNDKDLVFMSAFTIGMYTLVRFILKPSVRNGIWHAIACAIAIDLRIMAVILPAATVVALLALAIRKEYSPVKLASHLSVYLALMALLVFAFWPWLWLDPLGNLLTAVKNMARFRGTTDMYFLGEVINAGKLPWYYIPVWIGVSTPILYLILFVVGVVTIASALMRNILGKTRTLWVNNAQLQDLLFLGLFLGPPLAVIIFHSVVYNGWRHMYFIYPAFLLVSIRGLMCLWNLTNTKLMARRILILLVVGSLGFTSYWMVRWHPYQYLYFNVLAGPFAERFDVDYWAVAYRPVLDKIVGQDRQSSYSIYVHEQGIIWGHWQLQYVPHLSLMSPQDQSRIIKDRTEACSDYVITVPIGNRKQYSQKKEFELFDELKVDGQIIYTTFKRKIALYKNYSPAIGKQIDFSSGNTRCFLKSGWSNTNEDWGIWSVGNEAKLSLFMPKDNPRYLLMDVRGFVNAKQPTQNVEITVDGQSTQKFSLSRFEDNQIKVPIPSSAFGKEWLDITFKLPDAVSPKALGMAPDDRILGIGLKTAVFE